MLLGSLVFFTAASCLAATFTVDTTANSDSVFFRACTAAPGDCSLWGALLSANATTSIDTIAFNIPASEDSGCVAATGVCRIRTPSAVVQITNPVIIDGYTQPGAVENTLSGVDSGVNMALKIELVRANTSSQNYFALQSSGTVRGLAVTVDAYTIQAAQFYFSPFTSTQNIVIEGNIFGAFADGTPQDQAVEAKFVQAGECSNMGAINPSTQARIGGTLPAQRNWFVSGFPAVKISACETALSPFVASVQGNLFGTTKNGLAAIRGQVNAWRWLDINFTGNPSLLIGGSDASAKNVFARVVDISIKAAGGSGTNSAPLQVLGNYFGLAVDGVTPLVVPRDPSRPGTSVIEVQRAQIGGVNPGERNLFVGNQVVSVIQNPDSSSVRNNLYLANEAFKIINRTAAATHPARPTILSYVPASPTSNEVSLSYSVASSTVQASYPLTVEFYKSGLGNNPAQFLGRDTLLAAEANSSKNVVFTVPAGLVLNSESVILASASGNDNRGSSEFSRYVSLLTFVGNAPAYADQITPIRVRMQAIGPFRPQGKVTISDDLLTNSFARRCTATLMPTASPLIGEAECNLAIRGNAGPRRCFTRNTNLISTISAMKTMVNPPRTATSASLRRCRMRCLRMALNRREQIRIRLTIPIRWKAGRTGLLSISRRETTMQGQEFKTACSFVKQMELALIALESETIDAQSLKAQSCPAGNSG